MTTDPPWLNAMMDPSTYPHRVNEVRLIQTHISWVFVAGDRVYKVKKPVDFGFLDFTSLEKRLHFCREELRLNRRLCPEIYFDVWAITTDRGEIHLNGIGEPVEWAVVMRRLPEAGMMQGLLAEGLVGRPEIDRIIARLVPFYESAATGPEVNRHGSLETVRFNVEENFSQTAPFVEKLLDGEQYQAIVEYTRAFLEKNDALFKRRVDEGRIKEGHGDLYSANICMESDGDEVYIFDCIEFNERFRCGDVAVDAAFLAMDLDYHGLPGLSAYFATALARETTDPGLMDLMDFYKCYRAYVRCKIGCFTWASKEVDEDTREKAQRAAEHYFRLACRYAGGLAQPTLYVFFGLAGSGKSTLAEAWAKEREYPIYNSDRVRKELAGISSEDHRWEPYEQGLYRAEQTQRTYGTLARLAAQHLVRGESVILDATYRAREERKRLRRLVVDAGAIARFILCTCPEDEIRRRLSRRAQDNRSVSDGRWEIYLRQKETFDSPEELTGEDLASIQTNRPLEETLTALANVWQ